MARATQMEWTCSPDSGATPAGNANWKSGAATGAFAASSSACAGMSIGGAPAGAESVPTGAAEGTGPRTGDSVLWAYIMAAATVSEAGIAIQRPQPSANIFAPTSSTLVAAPMSVAFFGLDPRYPVKSE